MACEGWNFKMKARTQVTVTVNTVNKNNSLLRNLWGPRARVWRHAGPRIQKWTRYTRILREHAVSGVEAEMWARIFCSAARAVTAGGAGTLCGRAGFLLRNLEWNESTWFAVIKPRCTHWFFCRITNSLEGKNEPCLSLFWLTNVGAQTGRDYRRGLWEPQERKNQLREAASQSWDPRSPSPLFVGVSALFMSNVNTPIFPYCISWCVCTLVSDELVSIVSLTWYSVLSAFIYFKSLQFKPNSFFFLGLKKYIYLFVDSRKAPRP